MSKQLYYYVMPFEQYSLDAQIQAVAPAHWLLHSVSGNHYGIIRLDDIPMNTPDWHFRWLVPEVDLPLVKRTFLDNRNEWTIIHPRFPVIESIIRNIQLQNGLPCRLYSQTSFYEEDGRNVRFTDDYVSWVSSVFKVVKRTLKYYPESRTYQSDAAHKWLTDTKHT